MQKYFVFDEIQNREILTIFVISKSNFISLFMRQFITCSINIIINNKLQDNKLQYKKINFFTLLDFIFIKR